MAEQILGHAGDGVGYAAVPAAVSAVHTHSILAEAFHEAALASRGVAIHQMPPRNR